MLGIGPSPKVTIAMPVFNGGHYFRLALESALGQTYDNVEIIVVNDGSTDGGETESIAREYLPRIRYLPQPNRGVAGAMNNAVANMTGDYFAWLSHDDLHLPHKLTRQIDYVRRIGRRDAILFSDYDLIDPQGEPITTVRLPHAEYTRAPQLPLMRGAVNGCTLLIPAHLMRQYGPFDETLRYVQDYELWNQMLIEHELFHQPEVLVKYRLHPGQDTNKPGAVIEGDALWQRMVASRNDTDKVHISGSRYRYFVAMAKFLDLTPYKQAAEAVHSLVPATIGETTVSVVIAFRNDIATLCGAVRSALGQTHAHLDVIAVDDGSTENLAELEALAAGDSRLRIIRQPQTGLAAARNRGMQGARGEYIAFLEAADTFTPQKVQRQMRLMQETGRRVSHSSCYVTHPHDPARLGVVRSGSLAGKVYPEIIASCPVQLSTVMLHRTLVATGFVFDDSAGDALLWIDLAARHDMLGIDEPLSVVRWDANHPALDAMQSALDTMRLVAALRASPVHARNGAEIHRLGNNLVDFARRRDKPDWLMASRLQAVFGNEIAT